jgi:hypothetical protein
LNDLSFRRDVLCAGYRHAVQKCAHTHQVVGSHAPRNGERECLVARKVTPTASWK